MSYVIVGHMSSHAAACDVHHELTDSPCLRRLFTRKLDTAEHGTAKEHLKYSNKSS